MEEDNKFNEKWNVKYDTPYSLQWKLCFPQILACCVAHSLVINCGINLVFSAILLPQLMSPNSQFPINNEDASWIASVVAISTPIGALLTGPFMDKYGRKIGCIICAFAMSIAWILMAVSNTVTLLCFSRLLCGISAGFSTVAMVYVSEITHPQVRSALLCLNSVFFSLGILLTCVSGSLLTWKVTAICSASFCAMLFGVLWLIPESPHWLAVMSKGNENSPLWEKAEVSIQWLYRNDMVSFQETERLKENLKGAKMVKSLSLIESVKCLGQKSVLKPFVLLLGIFIIQQLSGAYVLIFYAVNLFNKVGGKTDTSIDALQALIIMGVIRFVMSLIVSMVSQKLGRRPLLIVSHLSMAILSLILAINQYSIPSSSQSDLFDGNSQEGHLFPIICMLLLVCFSALGVLVIPWTLPVELLPLQIRAVGGGVMVSWAYILMFIIVKNLPQVMQIIGISSVFFIFFCVSLIGCIYVYLFLPETLGKEFLEIQKAFL